ncbi:hypothetical protein H0H92_005857 [Tricholoma furcatifolium]|nr:hypothetical protein H0H92_005857 [Tricholoma furcatifolium]
MFFFWLVVESGAIYTSTALIQLFTYLLKMNAGVITECMLAQICAIAPGLILVRVASGSTLSKGLDCFEAS